MRVGLLSDTHGLLRPQALDFLAGSAHIVHAGDIVDPAILDALAAVAPLTAVRGNNDRGPWAQALPATAVLAVADVRVLVLHDLAELDLDAVPAGVQAVVCGHSHRPRVERRGALLVVNPGSCGPRRFSLPIAAGELQVDDRVLSARIVDLVTGQTLARGSLP